MAAGARKTSAGVRATSEGARASVAAARAAAAADSTHLRRATTFKGECCEINKYVNNYRISFFVTA